MQLFLIPTERNNPRISVHSGKGARGTRGGGKGKEEEEESGEVTGRREVTKQGAESGGTRSGTGLLN